MVDLTETQQRTLKILRERLSRVQRGEVWGSDHPGPYTAEEKAQEIARITELIKRVEAEEW